MSEAAIETEAPKATASRADVIEAVSARLEAEGTGPDTARVLAAIYATCAELDHLFAVLDGAGGLSGIGGILTGLGRRKKGKE